METTRRAVVQAGVCLFALLVLLSTPLLGSFRLSNPESPVYYRYAVIAGERVQIVEGTRISGDVHSNGDVSTASGVEVDGHASAVGKITGPGTVTGMESEGVTPVPLPRLATAAELQAMAGRTLQGNQTFTDAVVADVVFVNGRVRIQGSLGGGGTILATGDITLEGSSAAPAQGTRISLVSLGSIDLAEDRAFRGVIHAGQDVQLGRGVRLEGVVLAGRRAHLNGDVLLTFVDFDAAPPVIALQSPAAGSFLPTATPQIAFAFSDDLSGVDPATVVFTLDNQDRTAQATVSATGLSFQPAQPLPDGLHTIDVRVSDHSGKEAFAESSFTTDTVAPMLRISSPGSIVEGDTTPAVVIDFSDTTSGVDPPTLAVKVDGSAISCVIQGTSAVCEPPELAEGPHTVSAEVADRAGNQSTAASAFEIVLVRQPPVLRIVSPSAGLVVGDATPEIVLEYSDPGSGLDLATLSVVLDGQDLTAQCDVQPATATCEAPVLTTGLHTLQVAIENRGGLRTERERLFEITLQLSIVIESPVQGELTRESTVEISGTLSAEADSISVKGIEGIVQDGRFTIVDVPLQEGGNALTLVARSAGGGIGSTTVTVVRDTTAPRVVIASPREGLVTTSSQIAVTGEFIDPLSSNADMAPPVVRVNGFEARRELRTFFYDGLLLQPGENRVRVSVTDALGNEGEAEVGVTLVPSPAQQIEMLLGDGQSGRVGERLPDPLVVRLRDTIGAPLRGRRVLFEVTRGGGRLAAGAEETSRLSLLTDEQGMAQVDFLLGSRAGAGNHEVTVSAPGFPGAVVFCASAKTLEPSRIVRAIGDDHTGAMVAAVATPYPKPLLTQVFDAEGNPVAGVPVTYRVVSGGGSLGASLGGNPEVTEATNAQGVASATLLLGPEPGINNNLVEASFPGLGELPVLFAVTGVMPGREEDTAVVGLVLDNQDDPVPGVTLTIVGTDLETVSDERGRFRIEDVPVGFVALHVNGTTTPRPGLWAHLEFHFATIAGADNGIGMPIRLLPIDVEGGEVAGGSEEVAVPMRGVPGASLIVAPNSVRFPDGSRVGLISFTQVHADKVPMIAPMGSNFTVAFTVQPTGTRFDPPATVTLPNAGLPPGTEVDLFSFDHDVGEFLSVGTATVTADGLLLRSNPGLGISKAGWGGAVPPPPPNAGTCHPGSCTNCVDGRPVSRCSSCESCTGGGCKPHTLDEAAATANGEEDSAVAGTNQDVAFEAKAKGNCPFEYTWDFGDGETGDGPGTSHSYKEPGEYTVEVEVKCRGCDSVPPQTDRVTVRVIEIDLVLDGLQEEDEDTPNEEEPGAFLVANKDDDNGNDTPDVDETASVEGEDDLKEVTLKFDDQVDKGELKLEFRSGGEKVRVWDSETKGTRIELPKKWDLEANEKLPESLWVEATRSSASLRDIELALVYRDGDGEPIEDSALATAVDVEFEVLPTEAFVVSADDPTDLVVATVFQRSFEDPEKLVPVQDGAEVEWELVDGSGSLASSSSTTEDGMATVELRAPATPGPAGKVKGSLKRFRLDDESIDHEFEVSFEAESETYEVIPGIPATVSLTASRASYPSDLTSTVTLFAEVRDAAGNPVEDGTPVAWLVDQSTSSFVSEQPFTVGGQATATLLAPLDPVDQTVHALAGNQGASTTIGVTRVEGTLSSSAASLDLDTGETVVLTASVNAADGTPVEWLTSNGTLGGASSTVSGGLATATLTGSGGAPGPVLVAATIGDRLLFWEGKFVSSQVVVEAEHRYLVAGKTGSGFDAVTRADGTSVQVPYFGSSEMRVFGAPGSVATVAASGALPVEAYIFETSAGNVVPGVLGGHDLVLAGGALDSAVANRGASSLSLGPTDTGTIADAPDLAFTDHLRAALYVRPRTLGAGRLLRKQGAWSLEVLADGRVRATAETTAGSIQATSSETLSENEWNVVELLFQPGGLWVRVNAATSAVSASGSLQESNAPIELGGGFDGHVDDVSLHSQAGGLSLLNVEGLDAAGQLVIGPDGVGTFTVHSSGQLPAGSIVEPVAFGIFLTSPAEATPSAQLLRSFARGEAQAAAQAEGQATVYVADSEIWKTAGDVVMSFLGGDPKTTAGTIANMIGGVLIVGDIGSLAKNLWRMTGFSDKEVNYPELVLTGLGLATEFIPGAGEILDVPISVARALVAKIANSVLGRVWVKRFLDVLKNRKALQAGEQAVFKALGKAPDLVDIVNRAVKSEASWHAFASGFGRSADVLGDDFIEALGRIAADLGEEVAEKTAKILGELPDDALTSLKTSGKFDAAADGLALVLKHKISPELINRIVTNGKILTPGYKEADLLIDMGKVADVTGFDRLASTLANTGSGALGFRYELESAVYLRKQGASVEFVSRPAPIPDTEYRTDIDVIANSIAYQVKRSAAALKFGKEGVDSATKWISAALEEVGGDISKIKYIVPPDVPIPPRLRELFNSFDPAIEVIRAPHRLE